MYTLLWSIQSLQLLFLTPLSLSPFFNSFPYTSLYPLPAQMVCFMILLMLYHLKMKISLSKIKYIKNLNIQNKDATKKMF
jgi:hypothetical protein